MSVCFALPGVRLNSSPGAYGSRRCLCSSAGQNSRIQNTRPNAVYTCTTYAARPLGSNWNETNDGFPGFQKGTCRHRLFECCGRKCVKHQQRFRGGSIRYRIRPVRSAGSTDIECPQQHDNYHSSSCGESSVNEFGESKPRAN